MINVTNLTKPILKIGTHDGTFHTDDVLAVSLLRVFYDSTHEVVVLRTRDQSILDTCDILVDVGRRYDGVKYFDHHQDSSLKCSVALVWKALAEKDFPFEFEYVNRFVLDAVSDIDTNYDNVESLRGPMDNYYNITGLIGDMNYLPSNGFDSAVQIGMLFWKAILYKCKQLIVERYVISDGIRDDKNNFTLWLSEGMNIKPHLELLEQKGIRYVVHPHYNPAKYCLKTINSAKYPLPDFPTVEFFHSGRFLAIFSNITDTKYADQLL